MTQAGRTSVASLVPWSLAMSSSSIWQTVSRVLRIGKARYIVGRDLENNVYYELPSLQGANDPNRTRRVVKWNSWKYPSDYNPKDMPIQWDAWMRHTRHTPPTIEELLRDKERIEMVRHNARVLEMRDQAAKEQEEAMRLMDHADALRQQADREMRQAAFYRERERVAQRTDAPSESETVEQAVFKPSPRRG
ncbi:hypothetical protein Malapachy_1684 [Malassezia pachydermatis]|uniref:NADH dehydrogenase [ubiquinone] 1 alpha subcomplex subunit n=1 Tax=Malassezia pachydermatis TaxID=77020 RepID=A0A0M8MRU7_9BASI|nr:hypothetical protein Malapachy_1684 [Malassezia pachydermatis]KOS13064.1 hypothetical protein Malapachy_1684 [Malassezia pachydermatis]